MVLNLGVPLLSLDIIYAKQIQVFYEWYLEGAEMAVIVSPQATEERNWDDDFDVKCKLQPLESNCLTVNLAPPLTVYTLLIILILPGLTFQPFQHDYLTDLSRRRMLNIMEYFLVYVRKCPKPFTWIRISTQIYIFLPIFIK